MDKAELKEHFNEVATGAAHASYEERRWHTNPKVAVQAAATRSFIERVAIPCARSAAAITELGPGPGTWTKLLAQHAPQASFLLLDISAEMLARAQAALPTSVRVQTLESDFTNAHLPEAAADLFFSNRAIEYVEPKGAAVAKIARHLKPGGQGVIITKMPKPFMNRLSGRTPGAIHRAQITPAQFKAHLKEAGLTDVRLYPVTFSVPLLRSAEIDRFMFGLFGRLPLNPVSAFFSESYGVVFRKP